MDDQTPDQIPVPAPAPKATNHHVTIQTDGLEVVTRCGMLARQLRLRGYPGARFQVQDQIPEGMTCRMFTVVIPNGSMVDGQPGGQPVMFGEPALATAENRGELAEKLAEVMAQLEQDRIRGTATPDVPA